MEITVIIPAHKNGNNKYCENYRRIHLLNLCYQIYTNAIKNKLYSYYKNKLWEEQNKFQKDKLVVMDILH
jgi:hypothetical protein